VRIEANELVAPHLRQSAMSVATLMSSNGIGAAHD